ncbi:hypothetical protein NA57DRAFT_71483 [Rhizodiscina lignyota]|uniref:Uncharacterized protein n=1 Tax=Rhizodiscina lignyota TaxID=1504668 RepID=A0A9P4MED2_9PEZI|nr:hypothetical protein NA57DRAFT_71483 [Rhizodiscina lignyota]
MKCTAFSSIAAAAASIASLATADIIFEVNNGLEHLLDPGHAFRTAEAGNPGFANATEARVANVGPEACGCVVYGNTECDGNPSIVVNGDFVQLPSDIAGKVGCVICL